MKFVTPSLLSAVVFFSISCGSNENDQRSTSQLKSDDNINISEVWNTACNKIDESEDLWLQTTLRLDGSKAEMINSTYFDSACQKKRDNQK